MCLCTYVHIYMYSCVCTCILLLMYVCHVCMYVYLYVCMCIFSVVMALSLLLGLCFFKLFPFIFGLWLYCADSVLHKNRVLFQGSLAYKFMIFLCSCIKAIKNPQSYPQMQNVKSWKYIELWFMAKVCHCRMRRNARISSTWNVK